MIIVSTQILSVDKKPTVILANSFGVNSVADKIRMRSNLDANQIVVQKPKLTYVEDTTP